MEVSTSYAQETVQLTPLNAPVVSTTFLTLLVRSLHSLSRIHGHHPHPACPLGVGFTIASQTNCHKCVTANYQQLTCGAPHKIKNLGRQLKTDRAAGEGESRLPRQVLPSECRARGTSPPPPWGQLPRFTHINTHTRPSRSGACPSSKVRSEWVHPLCTRLRVLHLCCAPVTYPPQGACPGGHLALWDRETASLGDSQIETHAAPPWSS